MIKVFRLIGMILIMLITTTFPISCSDEYDDSLLTNRVDNLENRVSKLEELCSQINTNINSLQTIINALQDRDYITNVAPITKEDQIIGYTITFAKSNPITIYHGKDGTNGIDGKDGEDGKDGIDGKDGEDGEDGKDGKDGEDGVDGEDGKTPIIGVKKHTDGIYYWTVNNEWLLDEYGNKIKAQGTDGKNGEDGKNGTNGTDGANGTNGTNGKDGVTPKLKIQNNYWYVSYNNGSTWTLLGKATGENGTNGTNGEDGDNMFTNIVINDDNVTFILSNGIQFTVPTYSSSHLTIEVKEAGTLKSLLPNEQKHNIISLTIFGEINDIDIQTIQFQLQNLVILDMSSALYISDNLDLSSRHNINGRLEKIYFPKRKIANTFSRASLNLKYYPFIETVSVSCDSTYVNITTDKKTYCLDSLIYQEGITLLPSRSCCANAPTVVLPSTIKQIHTNAFGFGTDEKVIDLSTLICKATTPPDVGEWAYYYPTPSQLSFRSHITNSYYTGSNWKYASECTLMVPAQSVDLYKKDKYWKNFGEIIPIK